MLIKNAIIKLIMKIIRMNNLNKYNISLNKIDFIIKLYQRYYKRTLYKNK